MLNRYLIIELLNELLYLIIELINNLCYLIIELINKLCYLIIELINKLRYLLFAKQYTPPVKYRLFFFKRVISLLSFSIPH